MSIFIFVQHFDLPLFFRRAGKITFVLRLRYNVQWSDVISERRHLLQAVTQLGLISSNSGFLVIIIKGPKVYMTDTHICRKTDQGLVFLKEIELHQIRY